MRFSRFVLTLFLLQTLCACPFDTPRMRSNAKFQKGRPNPFMDWFVPYSSDAIDVHDHSIVRGFRAKSDCQPNCPQVDVWGYQYGISSIETTPIATRKANWKIPSLEARIISTTIFGNQPRFLDGLESFIKSFQSLKNFNGMRGTALWGYETFTVRVYVAKRNPNGQNKSKPLINSTSDEFITKMLGLGCEIAYVDNGLDAVGLDATFWRFMVAGEQMQPGERIRYLVRDADWLANAAETFSIGEWIASKHQYHRLQLLTCIGPLMGGLWAGSHEGAGSFGDIKDMIEKYPYRYYYGDDEAFLRDMMWPKMAYSGSVTTHYYPKNWFAFFGNPYEGSCSRLTQTYCDELNSVEKNKCLDVEMPNDIYYAFNELGERSLNNKAIYDMHIDTPRGQVAAAALGETP